MNFFFRRKWRQISFLFFVTEGRKVFLHFHVFITIELSGSSCFFTHQLGEFYFFTHQVGEVFFLFQTSMPPPGYQMVRPLEQYNSKV